MEQKETEQDAWMDPVSQQSVDPRAAPHQSFYAGRRYYFADMTSKMIFDADPQLWADAPQASAGEPSQ